MSMPLILTFLAGCATLVGGCFGVISKKPSSRLLAFSLSFAAGMMLLIALMEMLPAALATQGVPKILTYIMFAIGLLIYFMLEWFLPHSHPQDTYSQSANTKVKRTALLLTLGISLHNFPEGIATFVTASSNLELGVGIAIAVAIHNIPEGLAVAAPIYVLTKSKKQALFWAGISGLSEIIGGLLAFFVLGNVINETILVATMAMVSGIMVALSIDELMPSAKEIDPERNPSYGVLCGMLVMAFSLVLL